MNKTVTGQASPDRFEDIGRWRAHLNRERFWHSFEMPDGEFIEGVNSLASQKSRLGASPYRPICAVSGRSPSERGMVGSPLSWNGAEPKWWRSI